MSWPVAELDPVTRLRVLAAALPHVSLEERVIEAPFERTWGLIDDLERGIPQFEGNVSRVEVLSREGERIECVSYGPLGLSQRMSAVLRPGWCVMRSSLGEIGMAAAPVGAGATRFAHFEGSRWLGRAARPLFRRSVLRDLARLARLVEG
ncbi:MAG: hypothetical protein ABFS41_13520 [Myxococcota bacterium]